MAPKLDSATLRRLAVRASVCPATIRKVFEGRPVRGLARYRALAALEEAGLKPMPVQKNRERDGTMPSLRVLPTTDRREET
jgi:hypothetical protein